MKENYNDYRRTSDMPNFEMFKKQDTLKIKRIWAMPNKWTFQIKPIKEIVDRYVGDGNGWIDPFAGMNSPAEFTNDLNPKAKAKYHMKAIDFIKQMNGQVFKGVLFDPPYSGRQIKECYTDLHIDVQRDDTNSFFYYSVKREIAPKIVDGGYAICCGWNSGGFGGKLGFRLVEVLIVPHGSAHNDTIITIERKMNQSLLLAVNNKEDWLHPTDKSVGIRPTIL